MSPTIRLLDHLNFDEFVSDLEDDPTADHFFLFHTNSMILDAVQFQILTKRNGRKIGLF